MSPIVLFSFLAGYFALLVFVSYITSRKSAGNEAFFIANRSAKWYVVAFGMVGTTLSGVTLISVPGAVGNSSFGYFQFVLGNAVGFLIIAGVLLPLYYRLGLVSIYTYLEKRFGYWSYKSGAMIFLVSRTISSAFRLYIVAIVLQKYIFDPWNVPFVITVATCLVLIWIYTHKGGLKTIIITDTLQTSFLLLAVVLSVYFIATGLGLDLTETFETVKRSGYTQVFFWEDFVPSRLHVAKQFLGGVFVAIAMNGLDQDIMQKNLSMKTLGEAQRNMVSFTVVFVCISLLFLLVGALLYSYVDQVALDTAALTTPDHLFPEIALHHLPIAAGIIFMIGLTAATFATTDSALTALTTSFCIDFLNFDKQNDPSNPKLVQKRHAVHIGFSVVMLVVIWLFNMINDDSVVNAIFKAAGYTYGPLLGLFGFGILSKRAVRDRITPYICLVAPALSYLVEVGAENWFGYATGFEVIIFNAAITYMLLLATSRPTGGDTDQRNDTAQRKVRRMVLPTLVILTGLPVCQVRAQQPVNYTVLLNNENETIPLRELENRRIACIARSDDSVFRAFHCLLERYAPIAWLPMDDIDRPGFRDELGPLNTIIVAARTADLLDGALMRFIDKEASERQIILAIFGKGAWPSDLDCRDIPILWNPTLDVTTGRLAAMSIFGGVACTAHLPEPISGRYTRGMGFTTKQTRLEHASYGQSGKVSALARKVDGIMERVMSARAAPGGVVMVLRRGKVVFEKAYGYHTYDRLVRTKVSDIFDMASITKIAATTPAVMRLSERGVIDLGRTLGHYLPDARTAGKGDIRLRDVMLHEAGFIPYIPFYQRLRPDDIRPDSSTTHSVKVADRCYTRAGYYKTEMWPAMLGAERHVDQGYVYSDISMYVMKEVVERQTNSPIQDYIQNEFYRPLGMHTAGYLPLQRFPKHRIVPTEHDTKFRKTLLQGYVHDPGAALAGGVAGHAGLFATANDLAIFGQLLLNRGEYGGERYFEPETVDLFTSRQSLTSRRGLGFDRRDPDAGKRYPSRFASDATFGHTGFTGTCIWIDPREQLVYILLTNRVHPTISNKLLELDVRGQLLDAIYETICSKL